MLYCCCRGHITVALLSHCHGCTAVAFAPRRRCIVVLPPSDIAPTITAVAVALPSWLPLRCGHIALLALLSRPLGRGAAALMLGWAGALAPMYWLLGARVVLASNASLSRRCWCVVPLRPLPSSRSPCRHVVVAPMRSRCHCAFSRQSPPVRASCRPALLVGHVGRPWLRSLVGRVVGVVVAVPGGWSSCVRASSLLAQASRRMAA